MKESTIKITLGDKTMNFPIKEGKLEMEVLKSIFPNAVGLKYIHEDEHYVVRLKDNLFEILPEVKMYVAHEDENNHGVKNKQEKSRKLSAEIDLGKRKQFREIAGKFGIYNNNDILQDDVKYSMDNLIGNKKPRLFKIPAENLAKRVIHAKWMHKYYGLPDFINMGSNVDGNQKKITVQETENFSVEDLKKVILSELVTPKNEHYFKVSTVEVGDMEKNFYKDFQLPNGNKCNFETFCSNLKKGGSRCKIYVYTTENIPSNSITFSNTEESNQTSTKHPLHESTNTLLATKNIVQHSHKTPAEKSVNEKTIPAPSYSVLTNIINNEKVQEFKKPIDTVATFKKPEMLNEGYHFGETFSETNKQHDQIKKLESFKLSIPIIRSASKIKFGKALGEGGQGRVFQGSWNFLDVAIKTIGTYTESKEKCTLREIVFLSKVRHSNIIQLMAVCPNVNEYYLIMELCDGHSLHHIIHGKNVKDQYKINLKIQHTICHQVSSAITYLHNHPDGQIIHRDIKPLNILVYRNFLVKICDLGISRGDEFFAETLKTFGVNNQKGTASYMPPEVLIDKVPASAASDIFSLGLTIAEVFTKKTILSLNPVEVILNFSTKTPLALSSQDIPDDITLQMIKKSLSYEPAQRPSAQDLLLHFKTMASKT